MQKNGATGAVRATRFLIFLSMVATFGLLLSGLAGAQPPPEDGPTVQLGDVEVVGRICGASVPLIMPYTANAPLGIGRIEISARAEGVTAAYEDSITFDSPVQTYSDAPVFDIPADTPTSTWKVVVRVVANEREATDEKTVQVEVDPSCGDPFGELAVAVDSVKVSGPVCPGAATVSIAYTATVTTDSGYIDVVAGPVADLAGYGPLKAGTEITGSAGKPVSGTIDIEVDADTPTSKWSFTLIAGDDGSPVEAEGTFEIVANPGCATTIAVTSATVCPAEGKLTVNTEVTGGTGPATLWGQTNSPQGANVAFPEKQLTLSPAAQAMSFTVDVPKTSTAGLWNTELSLKKSTRMISVSYYEPGFKVVEKCGATTTATPGPTPTPTAVVTPSPTPGGGGGTNVVATPTASVGSTPAPTASGTPSTATPSPTSSATPSTPSPTATPGGNSNLAFTGSNTSFALALGVILIAVGVAAVAVTQRKRTE